MNDIRTILRNIDTSNYIHPIAVDDQWVSLRDPSFPLYSASCREGRFNQIGQVAYYLASGDDTARANVSGWEQKVRCTIAPQVVNCFDLPSFSKDHGIYDDYLKSKENGGYPLPQTTADYLFHQHGVTGVLYNSYPDHTAGQTGYCIVLRPQDGEFVNDAFFVSGKQIT